FIFSNRLPHRFLRHFLFWITWWIFFWLTYWFPAQWFPGWQPQGKLLALAQTDVLQFGSFVVTKSANGLLNNMLFTYVFVYILAPLFLWKEKYGSFIAGSILLLGVLVVKQYFGVLAAYQSSLQAYDVPADKAYLFRCAWENVLFNCPATGGLFLGIKLLKRWYLKQKETQQIAMAKTSAELQLLKAQVHPHFLFNTLNNIYSFTLNASPRAPEMIKKLSGLLHYLIHECSQEKVSLEKELLMIQDYIALEKIRYGEQLDITVDIRGDIKNCMIAPLLLLPFVENSFKHGTSKMLSRPWVNLNVILEDQKLFFLLTNSKPEEYSGSARKSGIGLSNVQKRLQLIYPNRHQLNMTMEPEHFTVFLEIDLYTTTIKTFKEGSHKKAQGYEVA
ncbi:MAG: histidine kinase, partial [Bacteroidota bacterium]|nr:histidine kinase [Bacteroidota bacterium]